MSATYEEIDVAKLTAEQRHALFDDLLEYVSTKAEKLPEWLSNLADKRLAEIEAGTYTQESWETIKKRLLAKWS